MKKEKENLLLTLLALLLANAKAIKTVAEPKNAIELNRRSFVFSARNLILSEINPAHIVLDGKLITTKVLIFLNTDERINGINYNQ